jgi:DNA-binding MarR family transcriptional regulator
MLKAIIDNSKGKNMENHLFELIFTLKRRCLSTEERIQTELELTPAEFNGLIALKPGEVIAGHIFAHRLGLSPSRGSRILARLVNKGFANMEYSSEDRRAVSISLTPGGLKMKKQIEKRLETCEEKVRSKLSESQLRQVKDSLVTLNSIL